MLEGENKSLRIDEQIKKKKKSKKDKEDSFGSFKDLIFVGDMILYE